MVYVVAKNFANEEKINEVIDLCRELVELTRQEDGCVSYELHQDMENPAILTMLEVWESKEKLDAHMQTEHFTRIVPLLGDLMTKDAEMNIYEKLI